VYLDFYGLKKRPFDMTPDPAFFFPSQKHTEALSSLIYAVSEKRGFVVITGEIGSGKTTVCRTLLQKLDPAAKVALITNTTLTAKQLLEAICHQFGLPTEKRNKVNLLSGLNRFLAEGNDTGDTIVLIVDEAQNLSVKALEEIRLISNMETDTQKLIQIMLLGQPELRDKLNRPDLEQLRQRVSLRYHLRSLDRDETRKYIEHRLSVAGDEGGVRFTKGALDALYEFSTGIPRLINVACDQALLMGYLRETKKIDEAIIREISAEFGLPADEKTNEQPASGTRDKPSGLRRFFRRRRERSNRRSDSAPDAPLAQGTEEAIGEIETSSSPPGEEEILRRLGGLRIASICAENGYFLATVDGVQIKPGDHLFGMKVASLTEDRIVFEVADRSYQLAIENHAVRDQHNGSACEPPTTEFVETRSGNDESLTP
jgi:general secretion pathway protein A